MFKLFQPLNHRVELKDKHNRNKADSFTQQSTIYEVRWIRCNLLCGKKRCTLNENCTQVSASFKLPEQETLFLFEALSESWKSFLVTKPSSFWYYTTAGFPTVIRAWRTRNLRAPAKGYGPMLKPLRLEDNSLSMDFYGNFFSSCTSTCTYLCKWSGTQICVYKSGLQCQILDLTRNSTLEPRNFSSC